MTCKLSLSSPFISIRIKLFVARSVVLCSLLLCRSLSLYIKEETTTHSFFCAFLSERDHEFSSAKTANKRGEEEDSSASGPSLSFFSPPASSEPKLLPQERKRIKISSLFSKKIQFFSPPLELFSFVLHKNHSLKTQWLVLNKPLVNPPVRSNSRSFKCKIRCSFLVIVVVVKVVSFFFFVLSFYHHRS